MGNHSAFSSLESVVLAAYKHGVLTKPLLDDLIDPFRNCDADSRGYSGDLMNGKDMIDIVLELHGKSIERPKLPEDWDTWTQEQQKQNDDWQEARWSAFNEITNL